MPTETARHREQRHARFAVRSGTVARRRLSEAETRQLLRAVDKRQIKHFGVRQLHRVELNEQLPSIEGGGLAWMDGALTLLDYASWRGRDHIAAALVRGGADPYPTAAGACRAALEALPQEGLVWLLRAVVRMRFASNAAAAAAAPQHGEERTSTTCRCDGCGGTGRPSDLCVWALCGHRRCLPCIWSGVTRGDPESLMLRCESCRCGGGGGGSSSATTAAAAAAELEQFLRTQMAAKGGEGATAGDRTLRFPRLEGKAARAIRSMALRRGLYVQEGRAQLEVGTQRAPFRAG
jgi:hypothetical protein